MDSSSKTLNLVRVAQALFFLNAVIWILIGISSLVKKPEGSPITATKTIIIAILMFGNAAAMLLSALGIGTGKRFFYYLAFFVLAINIILTVTDQIGLYDILTLMIDLILLGILMVDRRRFLNNPA